MDFGLSEQQTLIRDGARDYLRGVCTGAYVRAMATHPTGCSEQVWRDVVSMGWTGLIIPEGFGGAGLGLADLALVVEEMGAAAFPGPFFSTAVIGASALTLAGAEHQRKSLLPRIADGSMIVGLAAQDRSGAWPFDRPACRAVRAPSGWKISGRAGFVADAPAAHALIVAAAIAVEAEDRKGGLLLCIVERDAPGVTIGPRLATVGGDRQAAVSFDGVAIADDKVLGNPEDGEDNFRRLFLTGAALKAVEMVGGARRALEMTVEYAKARQQFGRPIGSFQAVQHMIAEIAIQVESARQLAYQAVWRLGNGKDAVGEVGLAKIRANEACVRACELAHQCHGAIGFTQEHDLQLFTRRALAGRVTFGDDADHRDAALTAIGI